MHIESAYLAKETRPGQFVEVRCAKAMDPLLRRPFSAHRITKDGIEILYEAVGKATEALAGRKKGQILDVIGPLGIGFDITRCTPHQSPLRPCPGLLSKYARRCTILVAGGIGVAPLFALAEKLAQSSKLKAQREDLLVLMGANTKSRIICERDFKKLGAKVLIATDDGSIGLKGFVTDLLSTLCRTPHQSPLRPCPGLLSKYARRCTIYSCGPVAMLRTVARFAKSHDIRCQISLEERMACGVGVCLGCPVRVKKNGTFGQRPKINSQKGKMTYEYRLVCKDGPVFDADEIAW
jgi:dihydroorotate dehydrogenase electron transfer subunit